MPIHLLPRLLANRRTLALCSGLLLGAAGATLVAPLPAAAQQVLNADSEIGFVSRQMGVPVEGRFRRWSAQVAFDPKAPQSGRIAFTIETGSATLGVPETDAEVLKPDWFNAARFPQATFQSSAIKAVGPGRYEVTGQLSIKGQTQAVTVPVSLAQTGSGAQLRTTATGAFAIKRLAFRIGEGAWSDTSMVADDVQVRFRLTLTGLSAL